MDGCLYAQGAASADCGVGVECEQQSPDECPTETAAPSA